MKLKPGDRVRLHAPTWGLTLKSDLGTVVCREQGYWTVVLDEPAMYDHGRGTPPIRLTEIPEHEDNLTLVEGP